MAVVIPQREEGENGRLQFRRQRKSGFHVSGFCTGAYHVRIGAPAQNQHDRVQNDRFTSARFACQHIKTRLDLQTQLIDDGKIANKKL